MSKILLKNGQIASSKGVFDKDILIENGKIAGIFERGKFKGKAKEIECKGKMILPGLIDVHVHFREPGASYKEDWITGSSAAVSGGVTTVFDMPNNTPPITTVKNLEKKRKIIKGRTYVNYGLYMGAAVDNLKEIAKAKNIAGVKVYIAHSTGNMGIGSVKFLPQILKVTKRPVVVHAEDEGIIENNKKKYTKELSAKNVDPAIHSKIRSVDAAVKAVKEVCEIAKKTKRHVHIAHVSSKAELDVISKYKEYGVTCEVSPRNLCFTEDDYSVLENLIKFNPPVRSGSDVYEMWKGIKFGGIDIVATDHAPHTLAEKKAGYLKAPSGTTELETMLPIFMEAVNNEGIKIEDVVKLCCEKPAEIFGVKKKGNLLKGYDADIVVVDMEIEKKVENKKLFTKSKWSPYVGPKLKGWPVMTFVNGEMVFKNGKIVGRKTGKEVKF